MKAITEFNGEYFFLSNFFYQPVVYKGFCFKNNEAAFQSAKCPERVREFCNLSPSEAKRLGRRVKLREDWEHVKTSVMYEICKAKFTQSPILREKLIATGDAELIEGNYWNDTVWGMCNGIGENRLGKILMVIREELSPFHIVRLVNDDGTSFNPPINPLKEKWDRLYPPIPMPQYSQVCDGYSCIYCGRCPRGENWVVPEEDVDEWNRYMNELSKYLNSHNYKD